MLEKTPLFQRRSAATAAICLLPLTLIAAAGLSQAGPADPVAFVLERIRGDLPVAQQLRAMPEEERTVMRRQFRSLDREQRKTLRAAMAQRVGSRTGIASAESQRGPTGNPTLQYDTDTPYVYRVPSSSSPSRGVGSGPGRFVGNYFNSGYGNPHTVSQVQVNMNGIFGYSPTRGVGGVEIVIAGAANGSGTAPIIRSTFDTFSSPGLKTFTFTGTSLQGLTGPFFVVAGQEPNTTGFTPYQAAPNRANVAIDVNSSRRGAVGIPFHGVTFTSLEPVPTRGGQYQLRELNASPVVPTVSMTGMGGTTPGAGRVPFNAILRVTGPSLPVELMHFEIED